MAPQSQSNLTFSALYTKLLCVYYCFRENRWTQAEENFTYDDIIYIVFVYILHCKNGAKTFQLSFFCLSVIRGYEMLIGRPVFSYTIGSSVCLSVAVVLVALTTVVSMATPEVGASRG